jgi:EmrB/QacA subfamily drug resistance transporter
MSSVATTHAAAASTTRRPVAVIVVMTAAALMDLLDITVVNVALPTLRARLHASPTQLEWIVGGYLLAFGATLIVWGRIGDVLGRRRVFVVAVAAFGLASLAAGTAHSVDLLIASRVVQGAAAGALVPQVLATFRTALSPAARLTAFGIYGAVAGLAAAAGVVVGGLLTQYSVFGLGWRAVFLVNVPVAAIVLIGALVVVPESRPLARRRLPVTSMLALPLSLAAIVYPLTEGRTRDWPWWMLALGVAGVVLLAATVRAEARRQRRQQTVLLDVGQFRFPAFSYGVLVQLLFSAALQGFSLTLVLWLQVGHGYTPLHTGLSLLAFSAGAILTAPRAGHLAQNHGRVVLAAGGALLVTGTFVIGVPAFRDWAGPSAWTTLGGFVLAGAGLGLLVVPLVNVVLAAVPDEAAGGASGMFSTAQQLGGAVGVAVIGTLFFDHVHGGGLDSAFRVAVVASAICYAAAGVLSLRLPRTAVSDERVVEMG